ncbi:chemotaxis protein CheY [Skermanella stibiiresistens SB22]|uniref:histidine kinase n=1 Tax=Skermanella stibiiresistens SB22 TaxID=1385369 RepID=W9HFN3_9PROT|nr:chemotaxis protein CheB [Skermanella stibiiresistens]EWY42688.1 chemotaxis protein CheY [Skermanella stibiiresistens SB22]
MGFSIVGIGASAGGLDACGKLLDALPDATGMAFILVQHLDPNHESMMVDLLANHTSMAVMQAADGMAIERDHLYVIPPGTYLSVRNGTLRLSQPTARHGARLPIDFLMSSLADECRDRAICVILSGTGADGSNGIKDIRERGGLVVVQHPDEAEFDGMPRNAMLTGLVDLVLPAARIPEALLRFDYGMALTHDRAEGESPDGNQDWLPAVIDLLRAKTAHDFSLYKHGTLRRRTERRMAMAPIEAGAVDQYLEILRNDHREIDLLSKDLLINVTGFFRDPKVFDLLAEKTIPEMVDAQALGHPLRVWVAGCSSGEEPYSLAMLFLERIAETRKDLKLQVFASDVDADAIFIAREGLYPLTIEADVSPARLARFFTKEDFGYRVVPELRGAVVFTVQDILADPPFSRLDLVSCRNLLIYLGPEAQAKVVALFHFALRENGVLLLGGSETIGNTSGRFEVIVKQERLYRRVGRAGPGELRFSAGGGDGVRSLIRPVAGQPPHRQDVHAELCRKLVLEAYAPAAVLINRKYECLYFLGRTDHYLRVAPGRPLHDVLAMAREGVRIKLRAAVQRAWLENTRVIVGDGRIERDGATYSFSVDVRPVACEGEDLLLICFVDGPKRADEKTDSGVPPDAGRVAELERELETTRSELQGAIHNLEMLGEEQKAINEEALSVNEEYQSTNEELLTSKEELQSLNEELTALNGQLHETLERQRTTSNDLQNVLYSSDVATLFLDSGLNIRFFTPGTKALFSVIPGDVGRPLADLKSLAKDDALLDDARSVLRTLIPVECEVEAPGDVWYVRRILPYRTRDQGVEGVVITFVDISERRRVADALGVAKRQAEQATVAKSRFLAAASHDLRQPLQTLALLQGLLAKRVEGGRATELVAQMDQTLVAMTGMLNALLNVNQIDAGTIQPEITDFRINDLLDRMRDEFGYLAHDRSLGLRVVRCGASIHGDPHLLERMIRNLLTNAFKYTERGKVLLGCRRHGGTLRIEIWDTGIGIPADQLEAIFDEYHQIDNPARDRSRGLGLGLSIVQRLGKLLGHRVTVRSRPGHGSVFGIEVGITKAAAKAPRDPPWRNPGSGTVNSRRGGTILVVEDDDELRDLLGTLLRDEGYGVATAADGDEALDLVTRGSARPDLILADYNLPGQTGLRVAALLRERLHGQIPVVILTGDISMETLRDFSVNNCVKLHKPVKPLELTHLIQTMLAGLPAAAEVHHAAPSGAPVIFIVDDDDQVRDSLRNVLERSGYSVEDYPSSEDFLEAYHPGRPGCILIDAYLPGMKGLDLLRRLMGRGDRLPAIMITGGSDVPLVVEAMKAGASDFIGKPVGPAELLASVGHALEQARDSSKLSAWKAAAAERVASLTPRQREIMAMVLAGHPNKNIAADLGISQRTVESHRALIMSKMGAKSLPALARLALAADGGGVSDGFVPKGQPTV